MKKIGIYIISTLLLLIVGTITVSAWSEGDYDGHERMIRTNHREDCYEYAQRTQADRDYNRNNHDYEPVDDNYGYHHGSHHNENESRGYGDCHQGRRR